MFRPQACVANQLHTNNTQTTHTHLLVGGKINTVVFVRGVGVGSRGGVHTVMAIDSNMSFPSGPCRFIIFE